MIKKFLGDTRYISLTCVSIFCSSYTKRVFQKWKIIGLYFRLVFYSRKILLSIVRRSLRERERPFVGEVRRRKGEKKTVADKFLERFRQVVKRHSVFEKRRRRIVGPVYPSAVAWTLKFVGEADRKSSVSNRPPVASRRCSSVVLSPIENPASLFSFLSLLSVFCHKATIPIPPLDVVVNTFAHKFRENATFREKQGKPNFKLSVDSRVRYNLILPSLVRFSFRWVFQVSNSL